MAVAVAVVDVVAGVGRNRFTKPATIIPTRIDAIAITGTPTSSWQDALGFRRIATGGQHAQGAEAQHFGDDVEQGGLVPLELQPTGDIGRQQAGGPNLIDAVAVDADEVDVEKAQHITRCTVTWPSRQKRVVSSLSALVLPLDDNTATELRSRLKPAGATA